METEPGTGPTASNSHTDTTHQTGFFDCREASASAQHSGLAGLGALGILLLPVIGEAIRLRARRGKR